MYVYISHSILVHVTRSENVLTGKPIHYVVLLTV